MLTDKQVFIIMLLLTINIGLQAFYVEGFSWLFLGYVGLACWIGVSVKNEKG